MSTQDPIAAAVAAACTPGLRILKVGDAHYWQLRVGRKAVGLGRFPAVSADAARVKAAGIRSQFAPPEPPAALLAAASPIASCRKTFLEAGRECLAKRSLAPRTKAKQQWLLSLLASLHDRPVVELKRPDFVRVLEAIEDGDRCETAQRAAWLATDICNFAANKGYIDINPLPKGWSKGVLKAPVVEHRPAITNPERFGELLAFCNRYRLTGHRHVATALHLAPYVFVRPGELRAARWEEIDLDKATWIIPAHKMKMRRPFLVPLSHQAVAILRKQHAVTGGAGYVFPGRNDRERPMSDAALSVALDFFCPRSEHVPHGFRVSASTLLNGELKYDSALVELQLAHARRDKVAAIYDRDQRVSERAAMMQAWADYVDALRDASNERVGREGFEKQPLAPRPMPSDLAAGLAGV